jgi:hypothetical protein
MTGSTLVYRCFFDSREVAAKAATDLQTLGMQTEVIRVEGGGAQWLTYARKRTSLDYSEPKKVRGPLGALRLRSTGAAAEAEAFASTVEDVARKLNGTLDGWGIAGPSSGEKSLVEWHQQIAVRRLNRRGT